jgi:hypothetical protein
MGTAWWRTTRTVSQWDLTKVGLGRDGEGALRSRASGRSWQVRSRGYVTAALSGRCRRRCPDEAKGSGPKGATRTGKSQAATDETRRTVIAGSARGCWPNEPRQVTAALWRFLRNVRSLGVGSGPCAGALGGSCHNQTTRIEERKEARPLDDLAGDSSAGAWS